MGFIGISIHANRLLQLSTLLTPLLPYLAPFSKQSCRYHQENVIAAHWKPCFLKEEIFIIEN